jgi:hypothetical protein
MRTKGLGHAARPRGVLLGLRDPPHVLALVRRAHPLERAERRGVSGQRRREIVRHLGSLLGFHHVAARHRGSAPNTRQVFWPPKPKELDIT